MTNTLKQQQCPYCHDGKDITENGREGAWITDNELFIFYDGWKAAAEASYISYCPMCGRDLRSDEE